MKLLKKVFKKMTDEHGPDRADVAQAVPASAAASPQGAACQGGGAAAAESVMAPPIFSPKEDALPLGWKVREGACVLGVSARF